MAERLHAIIKASAPALSPRTWYGMPAYAKDGNVVCFFQGAHKFKTRYATLRLQRQGEPRRRHRVAGRLRAEGVDCRRRGKDRRAREESGELRAHAKPTTHAHSRCAVVDCDAARDRPGGRRTAGLRPMLRSVPFSAPSISTSRIRTGMLWRPTCYRRSCSSGGVLPASSRWWPGTEPAAATLPPRWLRHAPARRTPRR